jgi:uncharacterized membrane protein SpoIIM required for sporulation
VLGVVDFHALGQVIWVSFAAGVGVTVLYSVATYGFSKADEARRQGHTSVTYLALALLAMALFAAAVVYGLTIMLHK